MKIDRHSRAKILTPEEIRLLFSEGLQTQRNRTLGLHRAITSRSRLSPVEESEKPRILRTQEVS